MSRPYDAVIFDLDGVLTDTARLHSMAWKSMFDEILLTTEGQEQVRHEPFDVATDYHAYVDGKPRLDGIRAFLASRDIDIPEGQPDDPGEMQTVWGLGNRKNAAFNRLLLDEGVPLLEGAQETIEALERGGIRIGVASSSRNCTKILDRIGLLDRFGAVVDGEVSAALGLKGKPRPDIFLECARRLKVETERCVVVEDAIVGVEAARVGGFGLVIGIGDERLLASGAHVVLPTTKFDVRRLEELADRSDERSRGRLATTVDLGSRDRGDS